MEEINLEIFEAEKHREKPLPEKKPDKNKRKKKQRIIMIILAVAVIAVAAVSAVITYPLLSKTHNPDRFVEAYVNSALNKDWETVYDYMPYTDSPFISYEGFTDFIQENPQENAFENANTESFVIEKDSMDGDFIYYSVDYPDQEQNWQTAYVTVKKVKDNFWKYDKYKIIPNQRLVCEAQIYAPAGAKVFIDGIELTEVRNEYGLDPANGKEISYSVFTSDYMFSGEHVITAQNAGCDDYESTVEINRENADVYLELRNSEENFNGLCENAKNAVQSLYPLAAGETADSTGIKFSSSFGKDGFQGLVKETGEFVYSELNGVSVSGIKIIKTEIRSEYDPNTKIAYNTSDEININFKFEYKYKISNTVENTSEERYDSGYAAVRFIYENSEWVIDNIAVRAFF